MIKLIMLDKYKTHMYKIIISILVMYEITLSIL